MFLDKHAGVVENLSRTAHLAAHGSVKLRAVGVHGLTGTNAPKQIVDMGSEACKLKAVTVDLDSVGLLDPCDDGANETFIVAGLGVGFGLLLGRQTRVEQAHGDPHAPRSLQAPH